MAADLTQGRLRRLPWDYPAFGSVADDVEVAEAVRASMSIPLPARQAEARADGRHVLDG
jgi:NTE family protein